MKERFAAENGERARSTQSLARDAPNPLIAGSWEGSPGGSLCIRPCSFYAFPKHSWLATVRDRMLG